MRRPELGKPKWGRSRVPRSCRTRGPDGFAERDERPLERVATEQGSIDLPRGPSTSGGFLPTPLQLAQWVDTRATILSDRYY